MVHLNVFGEYSPRTPLSAKNQTLLISRVFVLDKEDTPVAMVLYGIPRTKHVNVWIKDIMNFNLYTYRIITKLLLSPVCKKWHILKDKSYSVSILTTRKINDFAFRKIHIFCSRTAIGWIHVNHIRSIKSSFSACPIGFYGSTCTLRCRYPNFGEQCQGVCTCVKSLCSPIHGCDSNGDYLSIYLFIIQSIDRSNDTGAFDVNLLISFYIYSNVETSCYIMIL